MIVYSDEEIVSGIKKGGLEEGRYLEYLYEQHLKYIVRLIRQNHGTKDEAKDVFQDALIIFYRQVKAGKYEPTIKIGAYLAVLAKRIWINVLKKRGREVDFRKIHLAENTQDDMTQILISSEKKRFVTYLMNKLGEKSEGCRKILMYAIFQHLSMREIAEKMGFKDEQSARNKKYKCLNYLKEIIRSSRMLTKILDELK